MHTLQLRNKHAYGFRATFNQTLDQPFNQPHCDIERRGDGWVSPYHYGLDVGPIVLMVENHRSGVVWELMRNCRYIRDRLRRAGFEAGWLQDHQQSGP